MFIYTVVNEDNRAGIDVWMYTKAQLGVLSVEIKDKIGL